MAHKKAAGSTRLGRDSIAKRLGVKVHDGEKCSAGAIIIRQRGSSYYPGKNVKQGSDDTLYSLIAGVVRFTEKQKKNFTGKLHNIKLVNVVAAK